MLYFLILKEIFFVGFPRTKDSLKSFGFYFSNIFLCSVLLLEFCGPILGWGHLYASPPEGDPLFVQAHDLKRPRSGDFSCELIPPAKKQKLDGARIALIVDGCFDFLYQGLAENESLSMHKIKPPIKGFIFKKEKIKKKLPWEDFISASIDYDSDEEKGLSSDISITKSALLIIERNVNDKLVHFAIVLGGGHHLIKPNFLEPEFGFQVAYQGVNSKQIKGCGKIIRSPRAKISTTASYQPHILLETLQTDPNEQINSIRDCKYSGKGPYVSINEKINSLENLALICEEAYESFKRESDSKKLDASYHRVKDPIKIEALNLRLLEDHKKWILLTPENHENKDFEKYLLGRSKKKYKNLGDVFSLLKEKKIPKIFNSQKNEKGKIDGLKEIKITYLYQDGEKEKFNVYDHIQYDIDLNDERYTLQDGFWFKIDSDFAREIDSYVSNLYQNSLDEKLCLLESKKDEDEGHYNRRVSQLNADNILLMDQRLEFPSGEHSTPVEMCDLIAVKEKCFVHLKQGNHSSNLSHLFSQGAVAAEILMKDSGYRSRLKDKFIRSELIELAKNHCAPIFEEIYEAFKGEKLKNKQDKIIFLINTYKKIFSEKNKGPTDDFLKGINDDKLLLDSFKNKLTELLTNRLNKSCKKLLTEDDRDKQIIKKMLEDCKNILGEKLEDSTKKDWKLKSKENQRKISEILPIDYSPEEWKILYAIIIDKPDPNILKVVPFFSRITLKKYAEAIKTMGYKVGLQLVTQKPSQSLLTSHWVGLQSSSSSKISSD